MLSCHGPAAPGQVGEQQGHALRLQVSRSHLRVYPAEGVRAADRCTLKKVFLEDALDFAAPFHTPEGPALACLSSSGNISVRRTQQPRKPACCMPQPLVAACGADESRVAALTRPAAGARSCCLAGLEGGARAQVWAMPGLEALLQRPLETVLGFPLPLPADPHRLGLRPRLVSLSCDGQLALVRARATHLFSQGTHLVALQLFWPGLSPQQPLCSAERGTCGRVCSHCANVGVPKQQRALQHGRVSAERGRGAGGQQRGGSAHGPGALAAAAGAPCRALRLGPGCGGARRRQRAARAARVRAAAAVVRGCAPVLMWRCAEGLAHSILAAMSTARKRWLARLSGLRCGRRGGREGLWPGRLPQPGEQRAAPA